MTNPRERQGSGGVADRGRIDMDSLATRDWKRTAPDLIPEEGAEVDAMDSGGHVQRLLWWFPDRSMYVYFTPMFWRAP
jgi:hypothetical protein